MGLDYDHAWSRRYPVRLVRAMLVDNVMRPVVHALAPMTVRGLEYLDHVEQPVILVANHASHVDTPVLLSTLPVELRHHVVVAAASDYFFDRTWKSALWSFSLPAIPIERSRINRRSAETAAGLLEDGWNLLIFPEGGRTPDGWGQPFRAGATYLARRTGRPVVPVYLHGTRDVLGKKPDTGERPPGGSGTESREVGRFRSAPVTVLVGKPVLPEPDEDGRKLGDRIEQAVALLAAEARGDWWSARRQLASGTMPSLGGPDAAAWRRAWALGPPRTRDLQSRSVGSGVRALAARRSGAARRSAAARWPHRDR